MEISDTWKSCTAQHLPVFLSVSLSCRHTWCDHTKMIIQCHYGSQRCCGSVVPSVCPCVDLVNAIESTPLHISLSNLEDMLTMMRGCTLLILEVRGQRSRSQWTSMEKACEHNRDLTVVDFFIRLGKHVNHGERMNPIDFEGQRSRS